MPYRLVYPYVPRHVYPRESLSPSLGSDGRTSGWALRLCRLLPCGGMLPAMSVGSYGCRRRVLSLLRDYGDSTRNGDSLELDVLIEATMQVLCDKVAVPSIP